MSAEDELRHRLHALADRAGTPSADSARVARAVAERGDRRRRTRRQVLAVVGCLAVLVIAVPQLVDREPQGAVPASGTVASPVPSGPAVPASGGPPDAFGLPTRGSLADDQAFLDGVRALTWSAESAVRAADGTILYYLPDPPVESRNVVFAGDVPGGRWALVVGRTAGRPRGVPADVTPRDELSAAWFTGPPGATPEQMTVAGAPLSVLPNWPLALTDPRSGVLVVVTAPDNVVEVSQRPLVDADGQTTREWREVGTDEGIAITRVSPFARPRDGSTAYRVLRNGRTEARDAPSSLVVDDRGAELPIAYPRGRPSEVGEQAARFAAEDVLAQLGLSPAQVQVTAQWVGGVPPDQPGQAAVVTATLPSGAVVVSAQWLTPEGPDGSTTGAPCGQAILPAGPPAASRVQAVRCETVERSTGAPLRAQLVVVGPPEVALIRTYDGDRVFLSEHRAVDGVLVAPMPFGTETVEAVTASGVTLGRVDLLGDAADFGD